MEKFFEWIIEHRKLIMVIFLAAAIGCAAVRPLVGVNYNLYEYLPEDSGSSAALDVMGEEFGGGIPNARIMIRNVDVPEALNYKEKMEQVDGVLEVTWLDDTFDITSPFEMADEETFEKTYVDGNALFSLTIDKEKVSSAVEELRIIIGDENAMTGSAISTAVATSSTVDEIKRIAIISVIAAILILILTTSSWVEPFVILAGIGIAVIINAGTNIIFGEISFVTNAAGSILQLAVSLDYSVFLIHRFNELKEEEDRKKALVQALVKLGRSILSSGLTTIIGFSALCLMRYRIGPDLGLALAKGICISLVMVFTFMPGLIYAASRCMDQTRHRKFVPSFRRFGKMVAKITIPLSVCFILMIVPSYLASTSNDFYFGASHIFEEGTQYGDDTRAIRDAFGKKDTYVLMVPRGEISKESTMIKEIDALKQVDKVTSFIGTVGVAIPYEFLEGNDKLSLLESEEYSRIVIDVDADYEGEETTELIEKIRSIADSCYGKEYYLAGEGVSTLDLKETVMVDMVKVNLMAVGAVFLILLLTMRSLCLPVILVLTIETAIWINLSIYFFMGQPLFYIAYLIISSIQLGATVDYAILFTDRYRENRKCMEKKECIVQTISDTTVSILTSGVAISGVGFLLGMISSHELLSQLGFLLGRGSIFSILAVLFVLPGLLGMADRFVRKKI